MRAPGAIDRARAERRERADDGVVADLGVAADGRLDRGAGADDAVDEPGAGPDLGALADRPSRPGGRRRGTA